MVTGLAGIAADQLVIRRFRKIPRDDGAGRHRGAGDRHPRADPRLLSAGLEPQGVPAIVDGALSLGGLRLSLQPVIIVISGAMVALIHVLMQHTPIGTRIRAVAEDREYRHA